MTELQIAERIAREAHEWQKDTVTGAPYITHVERVVAMVDGDDAKAVAWLHDVVEDNPAWTFERLAAEGIPASLIRSVSMLTRRHPYTYADYIEDIETSGDALAVAVKVADLRDHLRPNCPERLRPRYEAALKALAPSSLPSAGAVEPPALDTLAPSIDPPNVIQELAEHVGGSITECRALPDGSGFATMSLPLPKDHWLTAEGYNVPPMPMRAGTDDPIRRVRAEQIRLAARYAIRASTMNGKEEDFDPDAMVQNFVTGLLGYNTPDALSSDAWANPEFVPTRPAPTTTVAAGAPQQDDQAADIRAIVSSYGYLLMRLAVAKDAQDTFDVCKVEFEANEAALKRLQDTFIHHRKSEAAGAPTPPDLKEKP